VGCTFLLLHSALCWDAKDLRSLSRSSETTHG
jgi:hypothetical protein